MKEPLYVLIAGSRNIPENFDYFYLIDELLKVLTVNKKWDYDKIIEICGTAKGADTIGKKWALERGYEVIEFPADWDKHGKAAGPIRNEEMVKFIKDKKQNIVILFWDGTSSGTKNTYDLCKKYEINYHLFSV